MELGRPAFVVAFPTAKAVALPEIVGRGWLAAQGIDDRRVSTDHVRCEVAGGRLEVTDLGSRNGTWLDGRRLLAHEPAEVREGSVLRFRRTLVVYRARFQGSAAPSAPLGRLVAPFGLRLLSRHVEGLRAAGARNVLVEGESGTGKELVAEYVAATLRPRRALAPVNLAAIAANVFEAQLFGHRRGAFSGAERDAKGVLGEHDGDTVFFDELGELPLELQPKLLRLIENREIQPVGATDVKRVDVLLVAATNQDLDDAAEHGRFRSDLLARFAGARLVIPPLRQRREDIFAITFHLASAMGTPFDLSAVEVEAVEHLLLHPWRLNVRELAGALHEIRRSSTGTGLTAWEVERILGPLSQERGGDGPTLEQAQAALVSAGSEAAAAKLLGISRGRLRRLLGKA